jgi:hypothetical protein
MADKTAVAFEIVNHGIQHSQYFQGCGTTFTDYTDVATGIGDDYNEALNDALENLAQMGWNVDIVVSDEDGDGESVSDRRAEEMEAAKADAREAVVSDDDDEDSFDDDEFEDQWESDNEDDERNYMVSVRVREYDPDHDEPHMKYVGKAIARLDRLGTDIHNAQTPSGDPTNLEAMRRERDKLERYLEGREIVLNTENNLTR